MSIRCIFMVSFSPFAPQAIMGSIDRWSSTTATGTCAAPAALGSRDTTGRAHDSYHVLSRRLVDQLIHRGDETFHRRDAFFEIGDLLFFQLQLNDSFHARGA